MKPPPRPAVHLRKKEEKSFPTRIPSKNISSPTETSPTLSLDLNIAPKIEPEPESDLFLRIGPIPPIPNPNLEILTPQLHTPLQKLSPDEDDDLFAEYHRLSHFFLKQPRTSTAISPAASSDLGAGSTAVVVASKKRKPRSGEMVRVSVLDSQDQIYFRDLVRRTRITFESLRILLIREEQRAQMLGLLARRSRADLKAAALMMDRDIWLNRDKRIIGSMPGICVGDIYFFRMELCVIGLHGQVQAGIDYVTTARSSSGEPIATSVIVSGGYEDDDDNGSELIYTGHGGRGQNLHKHCVGQKLHGGNLALERSMNYGIEVRVIRGVRLRSDKSPTTMNKIYVYDGLYKIVKCWSDVGKSGFEVYKYKLLRIEGQEEMGSAVIRRAEELKVNPLGVRPIRYVSLDMSMGKENFPVSLFNDIDGDRDPLLFEYVARPVYPEGLREKVFGDWGRGCECTVNCTVDCYCAKMNGGDLPYDNNGILLRGKPVVYECGHSCKCPPSCVNRVSQRGLRNRLEVFRSRETGWGVRSLDLTRAGSFVCEFSGIVLTKQHADTANGECLVYPNRFPSRWVEWGDISGIFPDYTPPTLPSLPALSFSIDVSWLRNVACYMSHSCIPNVFVQHVLYDHYNVAYPHLMIFALENIPPLRELSIDYGMVDECVGKLTK